MNEQHDTKICFPLTGETDLQFIWWDEDDSDPVDYRARFQKGLIQFGLQGASANAFSKWCQLIGSSREYFHSPQIAYSFENLPFQGSSFFLALTLAHLRIGKKSGSRGLTLCATGEVSLDGNRDLVVLPIAPDTITEKFNNIIRFLRSGTKPIDLLVLAKGQTMDSGAKQLLSEIERSGTKVRWAKRMDDLKDLYSDTPIPQTVTTDQEIPVKVRELAVTWQITLITISTIVFTALAIRDMWGPNQMEIFLIYFSGFVLLLALIAKIYKTRVVFTLTTRDKEAGANYASTNNGQSSSVENGCSYNKTQSAASTEKLGQTHLSPYKNGGQNKKDYTKYNFNGGKFGKGRLVLEVVRKHVSIHSTITFEELCDQFPDRLQAKKSNSPYTEKKGENAVVQKKSNYKPKGAGKTERFFWLLAVSRG
jgi:hypothetical protein